MGTTEWVACCGYSSLPANSESEEALDIKATDQIPIATGSTQ
jgi:hypothetical protein